MPAAMTPRTTIAPRMTASRDLICAASKLPIGRDELPWSQNVSTTRRNHSGSNYPSAPAAPPRETLIRPDLVAPVDMDIEREYSIESAGTLKHFGVKERANGGVVSRR